MVSICAEVESRELVSADSHQKEGKWKRFASLGGMSQRRFEKPEWFLIGFSTQIPVEEYSHQVSGIVIRWELKALE